MKIAIATPVLFDKVSPFNHLFKDILGGFLDAGYEVTRFVAVRNDEEDEFKYGYDNIRYIKYRRKESEHGNIVSRYIRDTITNIREAHGVKKSDASVLFEDVSYSSFWVVRTAKKRGMRVVAMLQDVWPDNAVQSGLIRKDGALYKYFEIWQQYVYRNADKIICISDDMKDFVISKGVDEKKIEVIYNWGYSDETVDIAWEDNEFVKKYNLSKDVFYAIYAGNIGKMQNVEIVVRAAMLLQDRKDIHFLIVGDGARKDTIEVMARGLENVTILPMQPSEIAPHIYSAAGVNIIPLVAGGTKTAMPSKTGVILSCGQPVIFTFGSMSRFSEMISACQAGISVDADSPQLLSNAISQYRDTKWKKNYGLFQQCFLRRENVQKYVDILKSKEVSE